MAIKMKHVGVRAEIKIKYVVFILVAALQLVHFCNLLPHTSVTRGDDRCCGDYERWLWKAVADLFIVSFWFSLAMNGGNHDKNILYRGRSEWQSQRNKFMSS